MSFLKSFAQKLVTLNLEMELLEFSKYGIIKEMVMQIFKALKELQEN